MNLRSLLRSTALAAAAVLALGACGSGDDSSDTDGAFSYTDDLGVQITLDEMPDRLLVQSSMAAALTDLGLGDKIVGVFGPLKNADGEPDSQVAGLDVDAVTDVTDAAEYGNIELEEAAKLDPDLVVTSAYLDDDLWYINDATADQIRQRFPILTVSFDGKTLPELLEGTERAAAALGADLDADDVSAAHEDFDAAADRVRAAGEALGDKTILGGSAAQDIFYVSNPEVSPDLSYWRTELGLPITVPDNPDPGGYFESLSWEKADKYPADVLLYDDRIGAAGLALFEDQPAFGKLEAAQDEAYVPWTSVAPPSFRAYADLMNRLADDLGEYA
jgi:iron complex transport system substrate-binding protein